MSTTQSDGPSISKDALREVAHEDLKLLNGCIGTALKEITPLNAKHLIPSIREAIEAFSATLDAYEGCTLPSNENVRQLAPE